MSFGRENFPKSEKYADWGEESKHQTIDNLNNY